MSAQSAETASPQKRSHEEVSAPEIVEDSKRAKGDDADAAVQESILDEKAAGDEAGPSDDKEVDEEEVDEDELAALDQENIIAGPRTRGKKIDFRKASEELGGEEDEDDDDADVTASKMPKTDEGEGTSDEDDDEEAGDESVAVEGDGK